MSNPDSPRYREWQIIELQKRGLGAKEIARQLDISETTVARFLRKSAAPRVVIVRGERGPRRSYVIATEEMNSPKGKGRKINNRHKKFMTDFITRLYGERTKRISTSPQPSIHRLPVEMYLSHATSAQADAVLDSIAQLAQAFEFEVTDDEEPPVIASYWKSFFVRTKKPVTAEEVAEQTKKMARAVELEASHQPQPSIDKNQADAEEVTERTKKMARTVEPEASHQPESSIDKNQADAVAAVITSLKDIPNAVISIGPLLLVKETLDDISTIIVQTLSQRELHYLEHNRHLFAQPHSILKALRFYDDTRGKAGDYILVESTSDLPKP